ncbi:hepcidin-like [Cheilinus undulatus]|uniref:hepcidin-like n=1 Tax=Cheilinus undulatus TaxID=241271 RepID=UPI001BD2141F|nr:hepcidin-like [Cheilinus undulatus]
MSCRWYKYLHMILSPTSDRGTVKGVAHKQNFLKMKTFSVAVAVAITLTFICVQESSAAPLPQGFEWPPPQLPSFDFGIREPEPSFSDKIMDRINNHDTPCGPYVGGGGIGIRCRW